MLGPARFAHIETCAQEVCRMFKRKEELEDCISALSTLDDILVDLRSELANLKGSDDHATTSADMDAKGLSPQKNPKKPDYSQLRAENDLSKAKRLVGARENAIKSVKKLVAKRKGT